MSERLAEARAHGDIRENADYDAAKNEQGLMEARIRKLRHLLDNSVVKDPENDGTVQIGSLVTVRDEYGDEDEYLVANPENRVPGFILASPAGPLGTALIGASVGDEVSYRRRGAPSRSRSSRYVPSSPDRPASTGTGGRPRHTVEPARPPERIIWRPKPRSTGGTP